MRKRLSFLVMIVVIALVAAACSSSGDDDTTTTADSGGSATTTAPAAATTTAPAAATTTAPPDTSGDIKTGRGVDADAKVITIGMLADLTGLFAPLVVDITDSQLAFWDDVNANGGIDGWTVEIVVEDTNYNVEQHIEKYEKIRNDVLALGQSTGSPTNVAALPKYKEDSMVFIPLSWYSGWAVPDFDGGLAMEQYTNYCIEAMNVLGFANEMGAKTVALATFPGDYGQDGAAGVKKAVDFYGMELVYDGEAAVIPGQDQTEVVTGIVSSGADWTFLTTNPSTAAEIIGGAAQAGYTGAWTGSTPSYDFRLLDSPVAPIIDASYYQSGYNVPWGTDVPGAAKMTEVLTAAYPDRRPSDAFAIGWSYSLSLQQAIKAAIDSGDITPEGFAAAVNSLTAVDFGGLAPSQSYAGSSNEFVQRASAIYKPSLEEYTAAGGAEQTLSQEGGGTTGSTESPSGGFFTSDAAAAYDFSAACYEL
ncbi:MAG: ABC transporter substrate-binding protein [Actinomycetia bacterium]|nr:ABC transporter substrate-binding protein [Actinomycetes bacterium]